MSTRENVRLIARAPLIPLRNKALLRFKRSKTETDYVEYKKNPKK